MYIFIGKTVVRCPSNVRYFPEFVYPRGRSPLRYQVRSQRTLLVLPRSDVSLFELPIHFLAITVPHFFTDRMPFLPPNQQCQSTEGQCASPTPTMGDSGGGLWLVRME